MIAIYTRQSIFKKDSLSTSQQADNCKAFCLSEEYEVFEDLGYSGKDLKRPGFEQMMKLVKSGQVKKILIYKLDRISRNISDFSNLVIELQKYGCELISVSENFDTSSPIGRAMIMICMVFAQMERENISQRVHDNYYYRTELGFWGGGPPPYGYQLARIKYKGKMHTVLEPHPEQSRVVQMIYDWYLESGQSISSILHTLNNNLKIPSQKGGLWSSRVIADILTKPMYTQNNMDIYNYLTGIGAVISNPPEDFDGNASVDLYGKKSASSSRHKRTRSVDEMYCNVASHDAIIDSATWLRVQRKKQSLLRAPARAGTGKNSIFTGLMKCGCCGAGVSWTNARASEGYYLCSTKKNRGYETCPSKPSSKKSTDPIIVDAIINHYSSPQVVDSIRNAKLENKQPLLDSKRKNELLIALSSVDAEIESLIASLSTANDLLIKYANEKITELDTRKRALVSELSALDAPRGDLRIYEEIELLLDDISDVLTLGSFEEKRDLVKILVKRIVFDKDKNIDIEYTI